MLLSCLLLEEVDETKPALVEFNRLNHAQWELTFTSHEHRISVKLELGIGVAVLLAVQGENQRMLSRPKTCPRASLRASPLIPSRDLPARVCTGIRVRVDAQYARCRSTSSRSSTRTRRGPANRAIFFMLVSIGPTALPVLLG